MAYGIASVLAHAIPTPAIESSSRHLLWITATEISPAAPHSRHRLCVALRPKALRQARQRERQHETDRRVHPEADAAPLHALRVERGMSDRARRIRCAPRLRGNTATCRTAPARWRSAPRPAASWSAAWRPIDSKISRAFSARPRFLRLHLAECFQIFRRIFARRGDGPQHGAEERRRAHIKGQPHSQWNLPAAAPSR